MTRAYWLRRYGCPILIGLAISIFVFLGPLWVRSELFPYGASIIIMVLMVVGCGLLICQFHQLWPSHQHIALFLVGLVPQLAGVFNIMQGGLAAFRLCTAFILSLVFLKKSKYEVITGPIYSLYIALFCFIVLSLYRLNMGDFLVSLFLIGKEVVPLFLFYFMIVNILRTKEILKWFIYFLIGMASIFSIFGIIQSRLWFYTYFFLTIPGQTLFWEVTPQGLILRLTGMASTPQSFAMIVMVASIIALYITICHEHFNGRKVFILVASIVIMLTANVLTFDKGACVGVVLIAMLMPFFHKPRFSLHYSMALLVTFLIVYQLDVVEWLRAHLGQLNPGGFSIRAELLEMGIAEAVKQPLTGVGIYNFKAFGAISEEYIVHNALIQVASEIGLVGGMLFALLLGLLVFRLAITIVHVRDPQEKTLLKALLLGLLGMLWDIQFEPFANNDFLWIYFGTVESAIQVFSAEVRR